MFSDRTCLLLRTPTELPPPPGAGWFDPAPPAPIPPASAPEPVWAHLMLEWNGRLLFARRTESGLWGFPSDALGAGESAVDGACRVGVEQILVDLARSAARLVHVPRGAGTADVGAGLFVRASRFRGVPVVADPRRVDRLAWSPPTAVPAPCGPGVADAAAAVSGGPHAADDAGHLPGSPTTPARRGHRSGCLAPGTAAW
jgi:hypothetical protein